MKERLFRILYSYLTLLDLGGGEGGGGGGRKVPGPISAFENFLDIQAIPTKCGPFTKMYWRTRFWKIFASRVSYVAMATPSSTPYLLKF